MSHSLAVKVFHSFHKFLCESLQIFGTPPRKMFIFLSHVHSLFEGTVIQRQEELQIPFFVSMTQQRNNVLMFQRLQPLFLFFKFLLHFFLPFFFCSTERRGLLKNRNFESNFHQVLENESTENSPIGSLTLKGSFFNFNS